ncbi:MAG TPA: hypothetical protein VMW27_26265 [Thermoanaerobaculia bacterium]|nr:hypothetical protein [Thermoanaerobaculia bacterium]
MHPSHDPKLLRWLAAESEDRADEAEEALFELFAALPPLSPPAGFADRVLARAVVAAPARAVRSARWMRWMVGLGLLAIALSLVFVPGTLAALAGLWSFAEFFEAAVRSVVDASLWLTSALQIGQTVFTVGEALSLSLARPGMVGLVVVCLLIAAAALRFLRDLVARDRSWAYVDPI